ncbi:hypothetical protein [Parvibaculum sp.]|uniref:hypothetical protein n=1 Tax=Parvibaculum sp. TaxID=2024848 RepID=UPI003BAA120B
MQFHKALICSTIILTASPAVASAWEHEHERGVDLYRTENAGMVVSLVCDPNTVYGTSESAVLIEAGNNPDLSAEVGFSFPDGNRIGAAMVHGRYGKATAKPRGMGNSDRRIPRASDSHGYDWRQLDRG